MKTRRLLSSRQKKYLDEIGLSQDEIQLYNFLLNKGTLTAQKAADLTHNFASAQYRLFYKLEGRGLIKRTPGRPMKWQAYERQAGLSNSLAITHQELQKLLAQKSTKSHQLELIVGRQELYNRYNLLAQQAVKSIEIYAIGIAYSGSIFKAQAGARRRGVQIRHIVQQFKASNYFVLSKWQKLGVSLRHLPSDRGFHFMIFDKTKVLITFSDPKDTDNRLSFLTNNESVIKMFRKYFEELWAEARPLKT